MAACWCLNLTQNTAMTFITIWTQSQKTFIRIIFAGEINGLLRSQVCVSGACPIQVLVEPGCVVEGGDYTDRGARLPLMKTSLDRQV